jgi:dTMP kinase
MKTKEPVRPVATPPVKAPTPPAAAPSPAQPPAVAKRFFGRGLANVDLNELIGYLVTIEGTDGVGRTTQIDMLRNWLEVKGFGVIETGWTRSPLVGPAIELAKSGNALNPLTFNLLYATDLADRFEHEVVPALKSGFVVLSDRYYYTAMARAAARKADIAWVRSLYGFAVEPDLVLYLKADPKTLFERVLLSSGLDYWEVGMDQNPGCDPYDSFRRYQSKVIAEFNRLSREFGFTEINARRSVVTIQRDLRRHVAKLLNIALKPKDLVI